VIFAANYLDGVLGKVDGVVGIGVVLGEVLAGVREEAGNVVGDGEAHGQVPTSGSWLASLARRSLNRDVDEKKMRRLLPVISVLLAFAGCSHPRPARRYASHWKVIHLATDGGATYFSRNMYPPRRGEGSWRSLGNDVFSVQVDDEYLDRARPYDEQVANNPEAIKSGWKRGQSWTWYLWSDRNTGENRLFHCREQALYWGRHCAMQRAIAAGEVDAPSLPSNEVYRVWGTVLVPGAYRWEPGLTLSAAIERAGGLDCFAGMRVRKIAGNPNIAYGSEEAESLLREAAKYDLRSVRRGEAQDPAVAPGDIIFVPYIPF